MAIYDEHDRPVIILARLNPPGWRPPGNAVNLLIPEMELQLEWAVSRALVMLAVEGYHLVPVEERPDWAMVQRGVL